MIFVVLVVIFVFILIFSRPDPYHIVVARYNEDLSWISEGDKYVKVYDKGPGGNLPNIGRESHTYLTYIVENYDNLPDVVFFTQGSPDHFMTYTSIDEFLNIRGSCSYNFLDTTHYLPEDGRLRIWKGEQLYPAHENFFEWFEKYIDQSIDTQYSTFRWFVGATFSVRREFILSRSRDYYMELLKQFPEGESNPEIGHYFERSWYYMFNIR